MESTIINGLITTSPLAGILFYFLSKIWGAYQEEIKYSKTRDNEDLILYKDLSNLMTSLNELLARTNSDLGKLSDKTSEINGLVARIGERQVENAGTFQRISDMVSDLNMEIRRYLDKNKQ